jgi:hypothetical protein
MRYTILRPAEPLDPRHAGFASLDELRAAMPSVRDCDLEVETMLEVRALYPDGIAMPVPVRLGSGDEVFLLGILPDIGAPKNPDAKIPFVLFVQAIPQHDADRRQIQKREQFSRRLWKPPVLKPTSPIIAHELDVELRATDLEQPTRTAVQLYARPDRHGFSHWVLYLEVGGVEMSIELRDPGVQIKP